MGRDQRSHHLLRTWSSSTRPEAGSTLAHRRSAPPIQAAAQAGGRSVPLVVDGLGCGGPMRHLCAITIDVPKVDLYARGRRRMAAGSGSARVSTLRPGPDPPRPSAYYQRSRAKDSTQTYACPIPLPGAAAFRRARPAAAQARRSTSGSRACHPGAPGSAGRRCARRPCRPRPRPKAAPRAHRR